MEDETVVVASPALADRAALEDDVVDVPRTSSRETASPAGPAPTTMTARSRSRSIIGLHASCTLQQTLWRT